MLNAFKGQMNQNLDIFISVSPTYVRKEPTKRTKKLKFQLNWNKHSSEIFEIKTCYFLSIRKLYFALGEPVSDYTLSKNVENSKCSEHTSSPLCPFSKVF